MENENSKKIKFVNTQFVVFFGESKRPESLISDFVKEMGDVFDQAPLTVPIPNEPVFENAPVVQFTSSNSLHSCGFARRRADYFHYSSDKKNQFSFKEIENDLLKNIERYWNFFQKQNIEINRIGFILTFFIEENMHGKLITNLINEDFKEIFGNNNTRSAKVEYISRIKTKLNGFEINNRTLVENKNVVFYEDLKPIQKTGILITRDFNTVPEKIEEYKNKFTIEKVNEIIKETQSLLKLDEIIKLLWKTRN